MQWACINLNGLSFKKLQVLGEHSSASFGAHQPQSYLRTIEVLPHCYVSLVAGTRCELLLRCACQAVNVRLNRRGSKGDAVPCQGKLIISDKTFEQLLSRLFEGLARVQIEDDV